VLPWGTRQQDARRRAGHPDGTFQTSKRGAIWHVVNDRRTTFESCTRSYLHRRCSGSLVAGNQGIAAYRTGTALRLSAGQKI